LENLSLSSFYSQTKKKATFREEESLLSKEREREKAVFVSAAAEKCVSRFESVCYYMMRAYKESLSRFSRGAFQQFS
jgi:arginyl-tRNA synthetase